MANILNKLKTLRRQQPEKGPLRVKLRQVEAGQQKRFRKSEGGGSQSKFVDDGHDHITVIDLGRGKSMHAGFMKRFALVTKVKDKIGHNHGNDGKFTSGGDGGAKPKDKPEASADAEPDAANSKPDDKAKSVLAKLGGKLSELVNRVPVVGKIKQGMEAVMSKIHDTAAQRYGAKTAKAIMASGMVADAVLMGGGALVTGLPVVTGVNQLLGIIPAFVLAEGKYQASKLLGKSAELGGKDFDRACRDVAEQVKMAFASLLEDHADELAMVQEKRATGLFLKRFSRIIGKKAEADLGDETERIALIADILDHVFGEDAVKFFGEGAKEKAWDSASHPRGPNGRFIPKGSAEAATAAKAEVAATLKGKKTPETHKQLAEHLNLLTVKQLSEIKKEYQISASGRDKKELVAKLAERLSKGRGDGEKPEGESPSYAEYGAKERESRKEKPVDAADTGAAEIGDFDPGEFEDKPVEAEAKPVEPTRPKHPATHSPKIAASFDKLNSNGRNFVSIAKLRAEHPELSKDEFDKAVFHLRKEEGFTASALEGRDGVSKEELAAAINEGGEKFGYLSRREGWKKPQQSENNPSTPVDKPSQSSTIVDSGDKKPTTQGEGGKVDTPKTLKERNREPVGIENLGKRGVLVAQGATKEIKEKLKARGWKYDADRQYWTMPLMEAHADIIRNGGDKRVEFISGLNANAVGVQVKLDGKPVFTAKGHPDAKPSSQSPTIKINSGTRNVDAYRPGNIIEHNGGWHVITDATVEADDQSMYTHSLTTRPAKEEEAVKGKVAKLERELKPLLSVSPETRSFAVSNARRQSIEAELEQLGYGPKAKEDAHRKMIAYQDGKLDVSAMSDAEWRRMWDVLGYKVPSTKE